MCHAWQMPTFAASSWSTAVIFGTKHRSVKKKRKTLKFQWCIMQVAVMCHAWQMPTFAASSWSTAVIFGTKHRSVKKKKGKTLKFQWCIMQVAFYTFFLTATSWCAMVRRLLPNTCDTACGPDESDNQQNWHWPWHEQHVSQETGTNQKDLLRAKKKSQ